MQQSLKITEIFYSLQGETNTVGLPTVFVRLTGCPLRCGYCDTAYAFSGGKRLTIDDILKQVDSYHARYVTVTGGEPLAQPACLLLLNALCNKNYQVSLETSGALDISKVDDRVIKVMDLKTPSSGELEKNRMENLVFLTQKDQVKFVIGDKADYDWSKMICEQYQLAEKTQILFSPIHHAISPTDLADWIIRDNLPVRFQIQLHKYLWQDQPGK
ncbi:MAG: 7-carboxy-7-deazaguanine synthase QueE [Legionellales bacterium]|nr:7-carboxy-7-deazaguanine synthase QueE [Legionellales bacterium]|tara:strand:+ start:470 stop:1114 length:645 start_codon:yes stop_codon:yes gene_type:complete